MQLTLQHAVELTLILLVQVLALSYMLNLMHTVKASHFPLTFGTQRNNFFNRRDDLRNSSVVKFERQLALTVSF